MTPATLDLEDDRAVMQGDDYELTVTVNGDHYTGVDFSVAGWVFAAAMRPGFPSSGSTPLEGEVAFDVAVDDSTVGTAVVTLTMPAASTAGLAHRPAPWRWDLQVTDPDGVVLTLLRGRVVVLPQVTT